MSSALFIRIVGGVFGGAIGTYISGYIYGYFNKKRQPIPQIKEQSQPPQYESKYKHVKSFEEILNIDIGQHISKELETEKINYEYDNEHGNTFEFKNAGEKEKEEDVANTSYEDYYRFYIQLYRDDNT
jgi:hypothetical protein